MGSGDTALLVVVGLWCIGLILLVARARRRSYRRELVYRMCSIRDRLYFLAITNELSENGRVFTIVQKLINDVIANTDDYTAITYLRAYARADHKVLEGDQRAFFNDLRHATPAVQGLVVDFYLGVAKTIVDNSVLLSAYLWARHHVLRHKPRVLRLIQNWALVRAWATLQSRLRTAEAIANHATSGATVAA